MMSFWVVPWSELALDAVLLGDGHVERQQPRRRGVDRHRRVHLVERDAVEQRVHVALVGDRDADLADLAPRQLVVGVVARLGGQVESDREAGLALGEVAPVELVRLLRGASGPRRCASPRGGRARAGGARSHAGNCMVGSPCEPRRSTCMHLGRDRVICAYEIDGVIVDPGPASCLETLLDGLGPTEPRALLLTHIHLDHAGATGRAVPPLPGPAGLRARARRAAPGRPVQAAESAGRLYGDDMWELWGEVAPVPEERDHRAQRRRDRRGLPGGLHARPRLAPRLLPARGDGRRLRRRRGRRAHPAVRASPSRRRRRPTSTSRPGSTRSHTVAAWNPQSLGLTHFGQVTDVADHLHRVRAALLEAAELRPRSTDEERFIARLEQRARRRDRPGRPWRRSSRPSRPNQVYMGLERYWRKRGGRDRDRIELPRTAGPGETGSAATGA